jgi:AcrR family transcriptional regulator
MNKSSHFPFAFDVKPLKPKIRQRKQAVQERSQATLESILGATLQVLLKEGYQKLTTTRVAERAGVSIGSLYQYFPDKNSLVMALKVQYFEMMLAGIEAAMWQAREMPIEDAARLVIHSILTAKRENLSLILALREPLAALGGEQFMRDAMTQIVRSVSELIKAQTPGASDTTLAARVSIAAIEGAMSVAVYQSPELLRDEAFERELVALFLGYLRERQSNKR